MAAIYQLNLKGDRAEVIPYPSSTIYVRGYRGRLYEYPNRQVAPHWHDELEFILVEAGNAVYRVNGKEYAMAAGDGLFVNANRLHSGESNGGEDFIYSVLQIMPAIFSENRHIVNQYLTPLICDESVDGLFLSAAVPWQERLLRQIDQLISVNLEQSEYYELETMQGVYGVLECLCRNIAPRQGLHSAHSGNVTALMNMISYIQAHFDQRVKLRDIAGAGAMCHCKCCALFKKYLHQSPFTYLQGFRIQKSVLMLSDSQMSVTEIANACGFSGASYFIEVFRKSTGITPGEFRRRLSSGDYSKEALECTLPSLLPALPEGIDIVAG